MNSESDPSSVSSVGIQRDRVWKWLYKFRGKRGFRPGDTGPDSLVDTCCAVLVLEGLGRLADVPHEHRAAFRDCIQDFQDPSTGLFADQRSAASASDTAPGWQASANETWLAVQALDALATRPAHRLRFLDAISDRAGILGWFSGLDWTHAGKQAELVACVLQFLIYRVEVERDPMAAELVHAVLDEVEALQDHESGLWGRTPGIPLRDGMLGVHRLLACFEYVHRPVMRVSMIIDAALGLTQSDGSLVGVATGGARSDLAAADALVMLGGQFRYRRDEIHGALRKSRARLLELHQDGGGFACADSFDGPEPGPIETAWLRMLMLAAVDHALPDRTATDHAWHFRRWPAPGYHRAPGRLNEGERDSMALWLPRSRHADHASSASPPIVSVVLPCYNLGRFLHQAVESVLAQTLSDVEIIIVDDGSTDEFTTALLDDFKRPRTRVLRKANGGVASARNQGIAAATGRYICCLDPDDRLCPGYLERAVAVLSANADVGIVTGAVQMVDERDEVLRADRHDLAHLLAQNFVAEAAVFRRSSWERAGGYVGTFSTPGIEDWDFWLRLCENGERVEMLPEIVVQYRIRVDQMSALMYEPERWRLLLRELVDRHRESYAQHFGDVIAGLGSVVAKQHAWIDNRRRAVAWWQRGAREWQRIAEERRFREMPQPVIPLDPVSVVPDFPAIVNVFSPDYGNTPASPRRRTFSFAPADPLAPPAVTIVSPFFNVGEIFHETAKTVFRQSLQQWEWIIVNDGSSDPQALAMLALYRAQDPRIRVLDHQTNLGLSAARNTGYRAARSKYVLQLDCDDLIEPTAAEKWFWFLETHPEFDFAKGYTVGFGAEQYLWNKGYHHGEEFLQMNLVNPTTMVRASTHQLVGGYDEADRGGLMDWDFWLRCANAGRWGATVPEHLDWYRRRPSHNDLWPDFDEGERQSAYRDRLGQKYPGLWSKGFPKVTQRKRMQFDPRDDVLPCQNLLAERKPRLLLVVPWLACGGSDRFNADFVEQLTRLGWEVTIATTLNDDAGWASEFAGHTPDIFILHNFLDKADYPRFLRYLVKSRQVDVVMITHSALAYRLLPYLRSHCPEVAFVDYCHIDEPEWENGGYPRHSVNGNDHLDLTVVSSMHLDRWMVREGASPDRIRVCYTGIDSEKWQPDPVRRLATRAEFGFADSLPVILFVGRMCAQKQPRVLAQTLLRLRDGGNQFVALIAGDGPDLPELRTFVKANSLESHVGLVGEVSNERVRDLMAAADIFFLPSTWEGISLAIYEAMACALAVVGADVGGQRELVTPDCGVLVNRGTEAEEVARYCQVLTKLLAGPEHRTQLGVNARIRVRESFKLATMGRQMDALLVEARRIHAARALPPVSIEARHAAAELALNPPRAAKAGATPVASTPKRFVIGLVKRILGPTYRWGVERGWAWLPRLRARVGRALRLVS